MVDVRSPTYLGRHVARPDRYTALCGGQGGDEYSRRTARLRKGFGRAGFGYAVAEDSGGSQARAVA